MTVADELTIAHRDDLHTLLGFAAADLAAFWAAIEALPARELRNALAAELPDLAGTYGLAASSLGADWYEEMREAAEAPGRFRAVPADLPDRGRTSALAGWATQSLFTDTPDRVAARELTEGSFVRLVADMDRDTVIGSLAADPGARGWARRTSSSCSFCNMIAGRGAVYSARTANFSSHDNCRCVAVPVFGGDPRPVLPYVPSQRFRTQAQRDAHNARTREGLRALRVT